MANSNSGSQSQLTRLDIFLMIQLVIITLSALGLLLMAVYWLLNGGLI